MPGYYWIFPQQQQLVNQSFPGHSCMGIVATGLWWCSLAPPTSPNLLNLAKTFFFSGSKPYCRVVYSTLIYGGTNSFHNRRATAAQIAVEVNTGSNRKLSECTVHHRLLLMGMHSRRPVRVSMLTRPPPKAPTMGT